MTILAGLVLGLTTAVCITAPPNWERAIEDGDFEAFKKIVESHADVDALIRENRTVTISGGRSSTPMEVAVAARNLKVVRYLEERGVRLRIDQAAELGDRERVKTMLKDRPWLAKLPNAPLSGAVRVGDLEMTKLLLAHGANPNVSGWGFQTPLGGAVGWGRDGAKGIKEEIALALLAHGADPHAEGAQNVPDIVPFVFRHGSERLLRAFLAANANPYVETWTMKPALVAAAGDGDLERVDLLLRIGLDPNRRSSIGFTPIQIAAFKRRLQVVELLLRKNAALDIYSACALGRREFVLKAVEANPKLVNATEPASGNPTLYFAAISGDARFVRELLERGADPTLRCRPAWDVFWISSAEERNKEKTLLIDAVATFAQPEVNEVLRRAYAAAEPHDDEKQKEFEKIVKAAIKDMGEAADGYAALKGDETTMVLQKTLAEVGARTNEHDQRMKSYPLPEAAKNTIIARHSKEMKTASERLDKETKRLTQIWVRRIFRDD